MAHDAADLIGQQVTINNPGFGRYVYLVLRRKGEGAVQVRPVECPSHPAFTVPVALLLPYTPEPQAPQAPAPRVGQAVHLSEAVQDYSPTDLLVVITVGARTCTLAPFGGEGDPITVATTRFVPTARNTYSLAG